MEKIKQYKQYKTDEQNKIYILGGKGVGKTTFFQLIFSGKYNKDIKPSEKGIIKANYQINKNTFTFKDLTDDESFTITKLLQNELEEVILIFILIAINDRESYEYAKTLVSFIKQNLTNNKELQIIILGNKYDIGEGDQNQIKITKQEVQQFFSHTENVNYIEISCKSNYNISKIKKLIDEIEIDEGNDDDENGETIEEEMNKKNKESGNSCLII